MTCPHCHKLIDAARLLVAAREKAGLTQAEAARRLKMSASGLYNYEAGFRTPRPDRLQTMLEKLNSLG